MEYLVVWAIEVDAHDAREAAERATIVMAGQADAYTGVDNGFDAPQFYVTLVEHLGATPSKLDLDAMSSVDLAHVG